MFDTIQAVEFQGITYDTLHGSPFDRGSADSYYGRPRDPHCYPTGTYKSTRVELEPGTSAFEAYMAGYEYNQELGEQKQYG